MSDELRAWSINRRTEYPPSEPGGRGPTAWREVVAVRDDTLAFWAYCIAVGATFAVFLAAVLR